MNYTESNIQQSCVKWFRYQYPKYSRVLIHVPNEAKRRTRVVQGAHGSRVICTGANRLKAEGMIPGVADLILLIARKGYGSLCIEMKSKTGRQSDHQKEWQTEAEKAGNRYVVCRSLEEFMNEVNTYLGSDL